MCEVERSECEVYMDDSIVKSVTQIADITDLDKTFATLREYPMKLNLKKRVYRAKSGNFMG